MKNIMLFSGLLAVLSVPTIGSSATLSFDDATCAGVSCTTGNNTIDQGYGDSVELDIKWDSQVGGSLNNLSYWNNGYVGLADVAYGAPGQTSEIFFDPAPGFLVTLFGLDLSNSSSLTGLTSQVTLLSGSNDVLFSSGTLSISGLTELDFGALTSADGIRLQFGPDAYNVAIDNIEFSVSPVPSALPVPLPSALWLFGSSLLGMVGLSRRKAAR